MDSEHDLRWVLWMLVKVGLVFGLLWLSSVFYPHESESPLYIVAVILGFYLFALPPLEKWIKSLVKQAMREKQDEDAEYARRQLLDEQEFQAQIKREK